MAEIHVPHIRQLHDWDCGLACSLMVLHALGVQCTMPDLVQRCQTRSVWTVDLAHLLASFGLRVHFLTITLGANPDYGKEWYYRSNMHTDALRVTRLFEEAAAAGVCVQKRALSWQQLRDYVAGLWLAIVLVDALKLRQSRGATPGACMACCCRLVWRGYVGHYVVVSGFDSTANAFVVHDPAVSSSSMRVTPEALDVARRAYGTDEDILLVSRAEAPACATHASAQPRGRSPSAAVAGAAEARGPPAADVADRVQLITLPT